MKSIFLNRGLCSHPSSQVLASVEQFGCTDTGRPSQQSSTTYLDRVHIDFWLSSFLFFLRFFFLFSFFPFPLLLPPSLSIFPSVFNTKLSAVWDKNNYIKLSSLFHPQPLTALSNCWFYYNKHKGDLNTTF